MFPEQKAVPSLQICLDFQISRYSDDLIKRLIPPSAQPIVVVRPFPVPQPSPFRAIFFAGLVCGVLDITQAMLAWGLLMNVPPQRILQSVASGALGAVSFQLGWKSAVAGVFFHFVIAFGAATVYWLASRRLPFILDRPVEAGLLYGECVYLFMNFVVVPLSRIHHFPSFTLPHILTGPIGHPLLVGLPIALIIRKYGSPSSTRYAHP